MTHFKITATRLSSLWIYQWRFISISLLSNINFFPRNQWSAEKSKTELFFVRYEYKDNEGYYDIFLNMRQATKWIIGVQMRCGKWCGKWWKQVSMQSEWLCLHLPGYLTRSRTMGQRIKDGKPISFKHQHIWLSVSCPLPLHASSDISIGALFIHPSISVSIPISHSTKYLISDRVQTGYEMYLIAQVFSRLLLIEIGQIAGTVKRKKKKQIIIFD